MDFETALDALRFMDEISPPDRKLHVVFHGGEPLLAGADFYAFLLPRMKERFGARLQLSMQSNLWALDGPEGDRLAELIFLYRISVGTSLDGFKEMCDAQRGDGYYEKTAAGIEKLRSYDIEVGRICTFCRENVDKAAQVFREAGGSYSIHGAVPLLREGEAQGADGHSLDVSQMARVYLESYEAYRERPDHARIASVDAMAEGCFHGEGKTCTFQRCLGHFAAIGPDGSLYSCQRFSGHREFLLGNVRSGLTEEQILHSGGYRKLLEKQDGMKAHCGDCAHYDYCHGGCLYSAFAGGASKDPYCASYKVIFDRIKRDMALEMAAELKRQLGGEDSSHGNGQPGVSPLLSMAGDQPHPYDLRKNLEAFSHAVELGKRQGNSFSLLQGLEPEKFQTYCMNRLGTLYLNLTYRCPLSCPHCSADAGKARMGELPPERFVEIVQEAVALGFRSIEFTGGEPLFYPGFEAFAGGIEKIRRKGTKFVFRTSFGFDIPKGKMERICRLFDTVMVSIDGDEASHDRRRGKGVYQKAVSNLERAAAVPGRRCALGLWAVLGREERLGRQGAAVRQLAERLGIGQLVFKEILPLGRGVGAAQEDFPGEEARIPARFFPKYSCGIGHNMNVEPNGDAYPCYAWREENQRLGNLGQDSLGALLRRGELSAYCLHGVDSNEKCSRCDVRYLCGGMCRAWAKDKQRIDSGDFQCSKYAFYKRMSLLAGDRQEGVWAGKSLPSSEKFFLQRPGREPADDTRS